MRKPLLQRATSRLAILAALLLAAWAGPVAADADGPDFYAVANVAADDVLNMRADPSATAEKIGEIPHDAHGLQSLGCQGLPSFAEWEQMTEQQRRESYRHYWCKVRYHGLEGWVAGRFLREDSAPARSD